MPRINSEVLLSQGFTRIANGEETIYAKRENNGITFYVSSYDICIKYNFTDIQIGRLLKILDVLKEN